MINWDEFENKLVNRFESHSSKSEQDTAKFLADTYDRYVKLGVTQYGNSILSATKKTLESFFYLGMLNARTGGSLRKTSERFSQGILLYWRSATMGIKIPPPGSIQSIKNEIVLPGLPISINISNTRDSKLLAKTLTLGFKTHTLTITGINTALVPIPGGGTVPTPFPWTGIK